MVRNKFYVIGEYVYTIQISNVMLKIFITMHMRSAAASCFNMGIHFAFVLPMKMGFHCEDYCDCKTIITYYRLREIDNRSSIALLYNCKSENNMSAIYYSMIGYFRYFFDTIIITNNSKFNETIHCFCNSKR